MTAPTLTKRGYELDDLVLPRVSSILATLAKPGLEAWRLKVGVEEATRISKTATELGTAVHALCEGINRGQVWTVLDCPSHLAPFGDAYDGWFQQHVAEVIAVEQVVYSTRWRFAGTLDLLARLHDGRLALVDLKTSKSLDGTYRLQLAGYADALEEMAGTVVDTRLVVNLPSDQPGTVRIVEYDDADGDRLTWRCLVRTYWWWQAHKDDWRAAQ